MLPHAYTVPPNQCQDLLRAPHETEREVSAVVWKVITKSTVNTLQMPQLILAGTESLLMGRKKN